MQYHYAIRARPDETKHMFDHLLCLSEPTPIELVKGVLRPDEESNLDAANGQEFQSCAIPLCDLGLAIFYKAASLACEAGSRARNGYAIPLPAKQVLVTFRLCDLGLK